ncbi:hypothetical protein H1C71_032479 [Ictidomys tridecemlineatus]|nr:hypothetical protein H1C71_032479 [Ictidomys tridecemlineatus]KAG3281833.1 hypothetical protein H1C71_032479 [Ictidomys tridecemlineatus]KAG3281834.1 hypothetical protein H1C71_032479 [Ictidomys tridecemlineatus]KAG3281835.1 hypothetical protein H1C71_032479 [Ictidomys tridecemlineatus]KAG3281836.1 hypothetical protein H1C71_032479 [Ictidomys tridecemlineatus]
MRGEVQGRLGLRVAAVAHPLPPHPPDLLRVRQEVAAAALRSPSGLEVHLPSSTAGQRRKQGLAQHRENTAPAPAVAPSFSERYWGLVSDFCRPHSLHLPPTYYSPIAAAQSCGYCLLWV